MLTSLLTASALLFSLQAQAEETQAEEQATEAAETKSVESEATAAEQKTPEAAVAKEEDKIICRRTQVIGSKFKKRICGTQAEWEQLARRGQISAAEFQSKGAGIRQAGN